MRRFAHAAVGLALLTGTTGQAVAFDGGGPALFQIGAAEQGEVNGPVFRGDLAGARDGATVRFDRVVLDDDDATVSQEHIGLGMWWLARGAGVRILMPEFGIHRQTVEEMSQTDATYGEYVGVAMDGLLPWWGIEVGVNARAYHLDGDSAWSARGYARWSWEGRYGMEISQTYVSDELENEPLDDGSDPTTEVTLLVRF